jgi:hypothetical protein
MASTDSLKMNIALNELQHRWIAKRFRFGKPDLNLVSGASPEERLILKSLGKKHLQLALRELLIPLIPIDDKAQPRLEVVLALHLSN